MWTLLRHALLIVGLLGCSPQATQKMLAVPGARQEVVQGLPFRHMVLQSDGSGALLHVYLEGDGRPWLHPGRVSLDPTPRRAVMLELFALDDAPSLYLGRPCYWHLRDPACGPQWWTSQRYSQQVVDSLNRVIDTFAAGHAGVVLFGHSGGGTLAMLLAARRSDVAWVVTLAGNLDIDAWTTAHGYTALSGSLNPALEPPLPARIRQYHLIGSGDQIITPEMIRPTVSRQPDARLEELEGVDHACCWLDIWPGVLSRLEPEAPP
jgi:hypothetical protein